MSLFKKLISSVLFIILLVGFTLAFASPASAETISSDTKQTCDQAYADLKNKCNTKYPSAPTCNDQSKMSCVPIYNTSSRTYTHKATLTINPTKECPGGPQTIKPYNTFYSCLLGQGCGSGGSIGSYCTVSKTICKCNIDAACGTRANPGPATAKKCIPSTTTKKPLNQRCNANNECLSNYCQTVGMEDGLPVKECRNAPLYPVAPSNLTTDKACVGTTSRISFNWSAVGNATSYGVKIGTRAEFRQNSPNFLLSPATAGSAYSWSIRACNSFGCGPYKSGTPATALSCTGKDLNERCNLNSDCRSNYCTTVGMEDGLPLKQCRLKPINTRCNLSSECLSNYCRTVGREDGLDVKECGLKPNNTRCNQNSECISNYCTTVGMEDGLPVKQCGTPSTGGNTCEHKAPTLEASNKKTSGKPGETKTIDIKVILIE